MAFFNSSSAIIGGGTFISAQGDVSINNSCRDPEFGLHTLRQGISFGAIHNSAERYPPPNCHPDTRMAVRQIILDWIHSELSESSFFWLYGSAGAGKTAILQAIAESLSRPSESGHNFATSFFFTRGKKRRDEGHFLFSTIAYQLALKVPGLRQHVNHVMELDPILHTKSMDVQLQSLIIDAFRHLSTLPQRPYLVIIDGLDECRDKATQQSILRLLCETITVHKLPLRFLIGSRPESHIRDSFDQESLYTVTRRVILDETFNPRRDIEVFLRDGFAKICAQNPILSHVEQPWPKEGIIDLLVQRASGQFIYAATVLKFVGADFCSPTKQLALVLKPDSAAFSDLDELYTQILSVYPSEVNIAHVLGIVSRSHGQFAEVMEDIFGMEEGELKLVLRGLSSLIDENDRLAQDENEENDECLDTVATSYVIPYFAHASFGDYLFNSSRSGPFHVNREEYENQITVRSFALIIQLIRMSSITRVLHTTTWGYFTEHLAIRFSRSRKVVKEEIMADINDLVQEFRMSSRDGAVEESLVAMCRLFKILQTFINPESWHFAFGSLEEFGDRFEIMFDGYRKMIDQSFFKSKYLGDILRFLPGVVVLKCLTVQGMAALYRIKADFLERLIKLAFEADGPSNYYVLNGYLSDLLQDRDRSQLYYCDLELQHISICRQLLSLLDRSPDFDLQPYHDLSVYVSSHFYDHLCEATTGFLRVHTQNISEDHPAVKFLHDLETIAYYVDKSLSVRGRLAGRIIKDILRWADMLNSRLKGGAMTVSNVDLMERLCRLTNKIYRDILCITRHETTTYITIAGQDDTHASFWTPRHRIALSWDLIMWFTEEIPRSFVKFITTPELSGPEFYIRSDIYHTQITEYSLEIILHYNSLFLPHSRWVNPDWSFREHIYRSLPTEMIFYLLRSIPSMYLIRANNYSGDDTMEIIMKWLQGLGSERPSDLYNRFQNELLQHKAAVPQSSTPQPSSESLPLISTRPLSPF